MRQSFQLNILGTRFQRTAPKPHSTTSPNNQKFLSTATMRTVNIQKPDEWSLKLPALQNYGFSTVLSWHAIHPQPLGRLWNYGSTRCGDCIARLLAKVAGFIFTELRVNCYPLNLLPTPIYMLVVIVCELKQHHRFLLSLVHSSRHFQSRWRESFPAHRFLFTDCSGKSRHMSWSFPASQVPLWATASSSLCNCFLVSFCTWLRFSSTILADFAIFSW